MGRIVKEKNLVNTRLATNYGGWMYCTTCNKNIGYLCYVTYDQLKFDYTCNCGSKGSILLNFEDSKQGTRCQDEFIIQKNRLCCPHDQSPLLTVLAKNLKEYQFDIVCNHCGKEYHQENIK